MLIGHKIKKIRELRNFTQEHIAEKLNITQAGYSKIERNEVDLNLEKLDKLAQIFEMKPEEILTFDEKYVLNNYGERVTQSVHYQNNFPPELKQLYEDKIKLLEEKVAWLEKK
jgi:transcriptional regulator with XRE-family HTH domain